MRAIEEHRNEQQPRHNNPQNSLWQQIVNYCIQVSPVLVVAQQAYNFLWPVFQEMIYNFFFYAFGQNQQKLRIVNLSWCLFQFVAIFVVRCNTRNSSPNLTTAKYAVAYYIAWLLWNVCWVFYGPADMARYDQLYSVSSYVYHTLNGSNSSQILETIENGLWDEKKCLELCFFMRWSEWPLRLLHSLVEGQSDLSLAIMLVIKPFLYIVSLLWTVFSTILSWALAVLFSIYFLALIGILTIVVLVANIIAYYNLQ